MAEFTEFCLHLGRDYHQRVWKSFSRPSPQGITTIMSGAPAIDTRSQNNSIKQKQVKCKANKKAQTCSCACLSLFSLVFRFMFACVCRFMFACCLLCVLLFSRSVQQILLTGKSSHKCTSGTRKKATQMQQQSTLRCFCMFMCFCFACFCSLLFHQTEQHI